MTQVTITIKQEHLDQNGGGAERTFNCPVALAFRAAGYSKARVGVNRVFLNGPGLESPVNLPQNVRAFIIRADLLLDCIGPALEPFEFVIEV